MVGVAQLVEHRIVIPAVVGSSPIVHPIFIKQIWLSVLANGPLAQLAEQRTLNPQVVGSIPTWPTTNKGSWTGYQFGIRLAKVAELVDALDLGSSGVTRGSSSLPFRTM